jgi:hypothetical protein
MPAAVQKSGHMSQLHSALDRSQTQLLFSFDVELERPHRKNRWLGANTLRKECRERVSERAAKGVLCLINGRNFHGTEHTQREERNLRKRSSACNIHRTGIVLVILEFAPERLNPPRPGTAASVAALAVANPLRNCHIEACSSTSIAKSSRVESSRVASVAWRTAPAPAPAPASASSSSCTCV